MGPAISISLSAQFGSDGFLIEDVINERKRRGVVVPSCLYSHQPGLCVSKMVPII